MDEEIVFNGRDNSVDLILKEDGSAKDLSSITRIDVVVDGSVKLSETNKSTGNIQWDVGTTGKVIIKLGTLAPSQRLAAGVYDFDLILYDASNTRGLLWRSSKNSKVLRVINVAITTTTSTTTTTA